MDVAAAKRTLLYAEIITFPLKNLQHTCVWPSSGGALSDAVSFSTVAAESAQAVISS